VRRHSTPSVAWSSEAESRCTRIGATLAPSEPTARDFCEGFTSPLNHEGRHALADLPTGTVAVRALDELTGPRELALRPVGTGNAIADNLGAARKFAAGAESSSGHSDPQMRSGLLSAPAPFFATRRICVTRRSDPAQQPPQDLGGVLVAARQDNGRIPRRSTVHLARKFLRGRAS
jgi:hypothetical protein